MAEIPFENEKYNENWCNEGYMLKSNLGKKSIKCLINLDTH